MPAPDAPRSWLALYGTSVPHDLTPRARNGVELFERGVRERPDGPAIRYFDVELTHREAAAEAHALAVALRDDLGVGPGDRVAVMLQNVPHMVSAIHAAWLLGAVVTPVNVMNKERELRHQLTDAGVRVLIGMEALFDVVDAVRGDTPLEHVVVVSELDHLDEIPAPLRDTTRRGCPGALAWGDVVSARAGAAVATPASPDPGDPALLCYTSGTTGRPKGAIVTHGAVAHNGEAWTWWYDLGPGDVAVAMAPLFHITGLVAHLAAARAAACPLLLSHRFDASEILRLVERWGGTWIIAPLTAYIALLEHPDIATRDLSTLRKCCSGGAAVSPAIVDRWRAATGVELHNAYGLTESCAQTHLVPYGARAPIDPDSGALSVGVPGPTTDSRIVSLEDATTELAHGEVGEIVTRGPMITPGYWERPEATAEALHDGWLRTGDVGLRDEQGWFWLVDRVKDMINASGYKVWPREVEDVLYQHPAVVEAAVVGVPDDYRGESVRAYVTVRPGHDVTAAAIIAHCRALLAVYKSPREVVILDAMPKTASGKILRRELREQAAPTATIGAPCGGRTTTSS